MKEKVVNYTDLMPDSHAGSPLPGSPFHHTPRVDLRIIMRNRYGLARNWLHQKYGIDRLLPVRRFSHIVGDFLSLIETPIKDWHECCHINNGDGGAISMRLHMTDFTL